jgi:uncharacterized protein YcfJ
MSLDTTRATAYLCGALAGGLTTAAFVGVRDRSFRAATATLVGALACGTVAVGLEEWTQSRTRRQRTPRSR